MAASKWFYAAVLREPGARGLLRPGLPGSRSRIDSARRARRRNAVARLRTGADHNASSARCVLPTSSTTSRLAAAREAKATSAVGLTSAGNASSSNVCTASPFLPRQRSENGNSPMGCNLVR